MAGQRVTIASMMKFTPLAALNLALLPALADRGPEVPVICFMLAALNLVVVQAVLLGRPLRIFHHTFLVFGTVSSIALTALSAPWSEPWKAAASVSTILIAWAAGLWAAGRESQQLSEPSARRDRTVPAFFQGMVIGFAIFALGATLAAWVVPEAPLPYTTRWYLHIAGAVICPILGGLWVVRVSRAASSGDRARFGHGAPSSTSASCLPTSAGGPTH